MNKDIRAFNQCREAYFNGYPMIPDEGMTDLLKMLIQMKWVQLRQSFQAPLPKFSLQKVFANEDAALMGN